MRVVLLMLMISSLSLMAMDAREFIGFLPEREVRGAQELPIAQWCEQLLEEGAFDDHSVEDSQVQLAFQMYEQWLGHWAADGIFADQHGFQFFKEALACGLPQLDQPVLRFTDAERSQALGRFARYLQAVDRAGEALLDGISVVRIPDSLWEDWSATFFAAPNGSGTVNGSRLRLSGGHRNAVLAATGLAGIMIRGRVRVALAQEALDAYYRWYAFPGNVFMEPWRQAFIREQDLEAAKRRLLEESSEADEIRTFLEACHLRDAGRVMVVTPFFSLPMPMGGVGADEWQERAKAAVESFLELPGWRDLELRAPVAP